MYYLRILKKIKEIVKNNQYPPKFNPKKWNFKKANCYAYALDLCLNDRKKQIFFPGCISDKNIDKTIWSLNDLVKRFKNDLDFLGISYRENDEILLNGEYRIAITYLPTYHDWPVNYHFLRQDCDGIWSEKRSWKAKVKKIDNKISSVPDLSKAQPILHKVLILSKHQ